MSHDDDHVADDDLWTHVTKKTKPLKRDHLLSSTDLKKPSALKAKKKTRTKADLAFGQDGQFTQNEKTKRPQTDPLEVDASRNMDRRQFQRLKKGDLPIEATLDLHGMTQMMAQRALSQFLAQSFAAGKRKVLVITGKGRSKDSEGVLQKQLPAWLNDPSLRPMVLAVHRAQPRHGGSGAFYVLLKRAR